MNSDSFDEKTHENYDEKTQDNDLIRRIEDAYRVYKLSEVFLGDIERDYGKDYGKVKLARLRLDFARHALFSVLNEAREKGVKWNENEFIKKFFYPNSSNNERRVSRYS